MPLLFPLLPQGCPRVGDTGGCESTTWYADADANADADADAHQGPDSPARSRLVSRLTGDMPGNTPSGIAGSVDAGKHSNPVETT